MRPKVLAVFAALALGLSACSDKAPRPEPTSLATTPTTSPAASARLPMPASATKNSPQGVTDFVSYYLRVLSEAYRSGDSSQLKSLSAPACSACASYVSGIDDLRSEGGQIEGGDRTFEGGDVVYLGRSTESLVTADVMIGPGSRRDTARSEPVRISGSTMRLSFGVTGDGRDRQISRIFQGDPK